MTQNKYDIKQVTDNYPWIIKKILRGQHVVVTHHGEEVCAVIPVKDLLRYEGMEMEKLEREEISDALKDVLNKINLYYDYK